MELHTATHIPAYTLVFAVFDYCFQFINILLLD